MNVQDLTNREYAPFYKPYIDVLGNVELLDEMLERQKEFNTLFDSLKDMDPGYAYAPGKWSIAELIVHIIDSERVFQYRALRFGRGDTTALPGFDQDIYVPNSYAENRSLASLKEEFNVVRDASVLLFRGFPKEALMNRGIASGSEVSVRALGFMISGHQKHHELVLKNRYL